MYYYLRIIVCLKKKVKFQILIKNELVKNQKAHKEILTSLLAVQFYNCKISERDSSHSLTAFLDAASLNLKE